MDLKKALIFGATGQDASYLAELLLRNDYIVYGTMRKASQFNTQRVDHLYGEPWLPETRFFLRRCDLLDHASIRSVIQEVMPDEVYNLAAQSHVHESFRMSHYTYATIADGTLAILEAIRQLCPHAKFYQASSSEMFGNSPPPQWETTPFRPRSPYACAKVAAYYQTINHREAYGLFASNGILFNHESPRRGELFVTRKITRAAVRIKLGMQQTVRLGNIDTMRDWMHAEDAVRAMWKILQHGKPDDFVVGSGESHSVRDFAYEVFGQLDLNCMDHIQFDQRLVRPTEVDHLRAYPKKANHELNWKPTIGFKQLVKIMVDADMKLALREKLIKESGL